MATIVELKEKSHWNRWKGYILFIFFFKLLIKNLLVKRLREDELNKT